MSVYLSQNRQGMYTDTSLVCRDVYCQIMHITNSIEFIPPKFPAEYQTLPAFEDVREIKPCEAQ